MRKSSCALPRGFASVAKNQGEGNERLDPAQPHFGVGAACHPGTLLPRAAGAGAAKSRCSRATLSSGSKQARPPRKPDKQRKISVAGGCCRSVGGAIAALLRASSPLPGRCPQASCPIFRPGGRAGVRAAVTEGGLRLAALSPSPGLLACCSKQLLGGSVAGCEERGRPGWKWCCRPGVAGQMPITSLL